MFPRIYYLLTLYLLANARVLLSPGLIDFAFCLIVALLFISLSIVFHIVPQKNRGLIVLRQWKISLQALSCIFIFMAWISGFILWQLDHRLDESLEGQTLLVQGQVLGLPKQEAKRQVFEFSPSAYWQCEQAKLEQCQIVSMRKKPLQTRMFSLALSDVLWFYFFRKDDQSALPKKIRIALYQYSSHEKLSVKGGESHRFLLKLRRPRSSLNFVGFDYETWLFTQGIHANAYVKNHSIEPVVLSNNNFLGIISGLRESLRQKIIAHTFKNSKPAQTVKKDLSEISQSRALILALTIGDRSFLSIDTKNLLIKTGTAHLLAISGMHIALMSALSFLIIFNAIRILNWLLNAVSQKKFIYFKGVNFSNLRYFNEVFSPLKVAAMSSLLFASVYALFAGFSLPTQRALITVICYGFGILFFHKVNFYRLWALAMLLVAIVDPFAVLSSGFYLSFIAVLVIQWVLLGHHYRDNSHIFRKILNLLKAQWAVFLGLMPLSMLFFSGFFPLALLCNLLAVPLVSFIILPTSLFASFLLILNSDASAVSLLVTYALNISELSINYLIVFLSEVADFFPKNRQISLSILSALNLFLLVLLSLSALPRRLKLLSLLFFIPLFVNNNQEEVIPDKEIRMRLLDVGQGLALIIETQNHVLLYDTGPAFGENFDAGSAIVLPELRASQHALAKNKLDLLILSHGDNDHIGGAKSILDNYEVKRILAYRREFYSEKAKQFIKHDEWNNCEAGQSWDWDGVSFEMLYPNNNEQVSKSNNLSCVLLIKAQNFSVLVPGDIEKQAERALLETLKEDKLKIDVLIAAHHGSNTSSSDEFLKRFSPRLILVSAGFKNQFGHPHRDVLKRYQGIGAEVLLSADTGALSIESWRFLREEPLENIQKAREQGYRFWRF